MAYNPVTKKFEDEFTTPKTKYDFVALARQFGYQGPAGMEDAFVAGLVDAQGNPTQGMINQQGVGLPGDIWRSTLTQDTADYGDSANLHRGLGEQGVLYQEQLSNQLSPEELQQFIARSEVSDPGLLNNLAPFLFTGGALGMIGAAGAAGAGAAEGGGALAGGAGGGELGAGSVGTYGGALEAGTGLPAGGYGMSAADLAAGGMGTYAPVTGLTAPGATAGTTIDAATGAAIPAAGGGGLLSGASNLLSGVPGNVLAGVLQGGLGYLGAGQQTDAYENVANQNLALGAPYRDLLQQSYGPNFDLWNQPGYADAFQNASDRAAKSVSAQYGNPYGNPGAMGEISNQVLSGAYLPAMSNYRSQLGTFGGLGLGTAGAAQLGGAQTAGGGLDAIGYGIGTALNKQPTLDDLFKQYGLGGNNQYKLSYGV